MVSLLIILAILAAIVLGYTTKVNTGIFAIVFAFILGCFVLELKPADVIRMWPISIFFVIFAVSFFYNFALVNGTLEKLSMNILYLCKKIPFLLPFIIYFAAALIAALGAGFFSVMAFSAPLALLLCDKTKTNKLVGAVAVNCGALSGANFMTSGSGVIFRGLMDSAGFSQNSFQYSTTIFAASVIFSLLFIALFMFLNRRGMQTTGVIEMDKPERFDPVQKTTLFLMFIMIFLVLFPPIAHIIAPKNAFITKLNSKVDVGLIAIVMSAVALLLKLAPQKQVIAKVPWETLIMICGVGMLISVAIKAGTIDLLSGWVSSNIPAFFVPIAFAFIGAFMSFFSSTLGVVCPALFPIVPSVAAAAGISPMLLFTCIVIGAQSSAISPFSSGGSLILGSCSNEDDRTELFPKLLFVAIPSSILFAAAFGLVLSVFMR
jgi:di/tricarboxylate transporter